MERERDVRREREVYIPVLSRTLERYVKRERERERERERGVYIPVLSRTVTGSSGLRFVVLPRCRCQLDELRAGDRRAGFP